jgi:hypothetical protein
MDGLADRLIGYRPSGPSVLGLIDPGLTIRLGSIGAVRSGP